MRASALLIIFTAARAAAFPTGDRFDLDSTQTAAGDGIHYTGTPDFSKATCAACHLNAARTAGARVGADDATLFTNGYQPGRTYQIEMELVGEHLGLQYNGSPTCGNVAGQFVPCNTNGFALEVTDESGSPAGSLCPASPIGGACPSTSPGRSTLLSASGTAIFSRGLVDVPNRPPAMANGVTRWDFYWIAPTAGTGSVTFNAGLVDGNGGQGTSDWPNDVDGDDVVEVHLAAAEQGGANATVGTGCSAAGRSPTPGWPFALVLVAILAVPSLSGIRMGGRLSDGRFAKTAK